MRPGFRIWRGSKLSLTRAASAARAGAAARTPGRRGATPPTPLIKVACPVPCPSAPRIAERISAAPPSSAALVGDRDPQQSAAPIDKPGRIEAAGDRLAERGAAARRDRNAPDRAFGQDRRAARHRGSPATMRSRRRPRAPSTRNPRPARPAAARAGRRPTAAALRGEGRRRPAAPPASVSAAAAPDGR